MILLRIKYHLYSVCVHTVICMYIVCKCVCTVDVTVCIYTVLTTGPCMLLEIFRCTVQYVFTDCVCTVCAVCVQSMCVYTLTTGPCTLLDILQVYCTVCLYILCVYCVHCVYRICMYIHSPQGPAHCWRFYRCTDIFCRETLWRRSSGSYRSPRGRYTGGCGSWAGLSQSTHKKKR